MSEPIEGKTKTPPAKTTTKTIEPVTKTDPIPSGMSDNEKELNKKIAKQALRQDETEKELTQAKKDGIIKELDSLEINTKDYDKLYTYDQLVGIKTAFVEQKELDLSTLKKKEKTKQEIPAYDPGWFDHTPVYPNYPTGVWRSSVDDSILPNAKNRDVQQEMRA